MMNSDINMRIATNLNRLMEHHDVTQLELAEYMNVSQATISNWCKGSKMPRMDKIDKLCKFFNVSRTELMDSHSTDLSNISNLSFPAALPVPILGDICAGNGIFCEENFEGYFFVDQSIKADFCVRVRGDSMIDACISDNDIAFIKKTYDYKNNSVYAVLLNSECEATLKKVFWQGDTILLSPCNSEFEPMIVDASEVTILGECIGVFHNMK